MIGESSSSHSIRIGNALPIAFSVLDINAVIINGGVSCEACGDEAWRMSRSLSPHLRKQEGYGSPSPESIIFTRKAEKIIDNFSRTISKLHTDH